MRYENLFAFLMVPLLAVVSVFGQGTQVVYDPNMNDAKFETAVGEEKLVRNNVLPKARDHWAEAACDEEFEVMGVVKGSFSKPKSNQTLVFYQFCQTGNGFGNNGLVLIENGKIAGSYIAESGWALDITRLADINQNGLDEFALFYSGGLHQGQGGTGVDILEFGAGAVKGFGWFQAESFGEETGGLAYKVTVKPGKIPVFYREKYISAANDKWRKSGKIARFNLGKTYSKFRVLK